MARKKNIRKPKIGLALGSGLARGWAHIGVINALRKHGFEPDIYAGTSIGALVAGVEILGLLDELEDWARSLNKVSVMKYLDLRVAGGGLIGGKRFYKLMNDRIPNVNIEDMPKAYTAIAADLTTGHEIWLRKGPLLEAMRSSFALPGVFPPVRRGRRFLIDGALVNPVPVSVCQSLGADMTIAVDLNADIMGKVRKTGEIYPIVAGFDPLNEEEDVSLKAKFSKFFSIREHLFKRDPHGPSVFGVMISALNIVQDRVSKSRFAGFTPDVLIAPKIGHIGLVEFEKVDELIKAGEDAIERALPDLKEAYKVLCVDGFDENEDV